jgi:hypothetical protein
VIGTDCIGVMPSKPEIDGDIPNHTS